MTRNRAAALTLLALVFIASCSTTGPTGPEPVSPPIETRTISGTVALPQGAAPDLSELSVVSFAGQATVRDDGTFSLVVPDTELPQVLLLMGSGPSPVALGHVAADDASVVVDASSTALALVLLNPFTTMFSYEDRATIITMIEAKDWWPELVDWTEEALGRSSSGRIDERVEPALLQLASELAIDVLDDWPGGGLSMAGPWFVDADGSAVVAVNPGPAYCVATFRSSPEDSMTALLNSDRDRMHIRPSWPPFVDATSTTNTTIDLGDGSFNVTFTRGDLSTIDPGTANGKASLWNVGRAITELLALATGVTDCPDLARLELSDAHCEPLASRARATDTVGLVREFLGLMEDESELVSEWFWEEETPGAALYVETICPLLSGIAFSTEVLAPDETRIPFHASLAQAPDFDSQAIAQENGTLTESGTNTPPRALFTTAPQGAQPGELIVFDASESFDPGDPEAALQYRWDWENDGVWDTSWDNVDVIGHAFGTAGPKEVALQVLAHSGLSALTVHVVNIGGGQESAGHILLLRDAVPWGAEVPPVMDQMLEIMGFEEGPGPGQYEVVGSAEMDTIGLSPGEDLVIVQSDQPQAFYDAYAENQVRLLKFVSEGGTLFWEACDAGWNGGSIETAGIVLPGAVDLVPYETWYNYVVMPGAPIVQGLPPFLYGQYASHAAIEDLPDGAVAYVLDDREHATLVEFSYGDGWVIMTTKPLEWNFYNNWTSGEVMPHVVSYVLGIPLVHDFGDIVKPDQRGRPRRNSGAGHLTSGMH